MITDPNQLVAAHSLLPIHLVALLNDLPGETALQVVPNKAGNLAVLDDQGVYLGRIDFKAGQFIPL